MKDVRFFIDTEADFYYNIPSPHFSKLDLIKWNLNKLRGRVYRYPQPSRQGVANIVSVLKKYQFPATFCICGHLYLKECSGKHSESLKPKSKWFHNKIGKDWYYWDAGGNYKSHPGQYLGDFIESEMKVPYFKFGLHAFAHECLTFEGREVLDALIKEGIKNAKSLGIKIESFGAPFEMIDDVSDSSKVFEILKKNGIKETQYAGQDDGLRKLRKFDIRKPFDKNGVTCLWISSYVEGTDSEEKIKKILEEIKSMPQDCTYVLATHDFTWKSTEKLEMLIKGIMDIK